MANLIIQWNARGIQNKLASLAEMASDNKWPILLALQETNHHSVNLINKLNRLHIQNYVGFFSKLTGYPDNHINNPVNRVGPGWGTGIFVRSDVTHQDITKDIKSNLQITVVKIKSSTMDKEWTVCSLYAPQSSLKKADITALVNQLSSPFLLLGDFNAQHRAWGNNSSNTNGNQVAEFLVQNDSTLLNTGEKTFFSQACSSESAIDLSICSPEETAFVHWSVWPNDNPDDHYPIHIEIP